MAWDTHTDAETAALLGARIDVDRTGAGFVAGMIDPKGRREVVA